MLNKCASINSGGQGSCEEIKHMIQIYTDWANYYLEQHKSKRKITDLSVDARDGLLLAEIIEAVTKVKVPNLIKKPKTQQQTKEEKSQTKTTLQIIVSLRLMKTNMKDQ
ncbi:CLUMA_CG001361, isoform A [Clunio marinus]|uniref:CLUMA_CG001361, isoform A n=1 Tax=Clunio marinus TaxID=568069 RepID=A0A1J1HJH4_9DIPT|nr:CLUMA_CG001361, isoform A [Clunio marinus]